MARLDSHRARTDYNLYAGLMGASASAADTAFVLARVRQVSAHEVGHTLGLAHNYIASTYERGVGDGLSAAARSTRRERRHRSSRRRTRVGPGAYDVWAIHWGYGIFPPATERDSLRAIVADGLKKGYLFLSDADARPEYGSDPRVNLWDDAATPLEFLEHADGRAPRGDPTVRRAQHSVGEPIALLQERFVPAVLLPSLRDQRHVEGDRRDGVQQRRARRRAAGDARRALATAGRRTASHARCSAAGGAGDSRYGADAAGAGRVLGHADVELFGSRTRPAFDELGAARTLAQMIVDMILQRDRAARLVEFATRGAGPHLTLGGNHRQADGTTWDAPVAASAKLAALQRVTQRAVVEKLLTLAADSDAAPEVRAMAELKMADLRAKARVKQAAARTDEARAHWLSIVNDFTRWIEKRELPKLSPALVPPPGDPFGMP